MESPITDVQATVLKSVLKQFDESYLTLADEAFVAAGWFGYPVPEDYLDLTYKEAVIVTLYLNRKRKARD